MSQTGIEIYTAIRNDRLLLFRGLIAIGLLLVTILLGLNAEPDQARDIVRHYGYYFNWILLAGLVLYLGKLLFCYKRGFRESDLCQQAPRVGGLRLLMLGVSTVAVGASVVFHQADLDYKILMDDYLLAATAKEMHISGEVSVAEFGRNVAGEFEVLQSYVDKRPWFYPFLVSLVHDVLGYHVKNPFLVNVICAVSLLTLVFVLGYWLAGGSGAVLAVLLWASLPLLQQNATGGGMEMLNLLMLHVVMLLAIIYLRRPSFASEGALCLAGCVLTYSRYESGLFLVAILVCVLIGWWRERKALLSWGAILAAPLLLAVVLQTRIYVDTQSSWELADGVVEPFSLLHLWANLPHAFRFFWSRDPAIANSLLLGILALPALFVFAWGCYRQRATSWWRKPENLVWCLFSVFLLLNLAVVLCFHAAQFDQRYVARYSLPTHMLIVFCVVSGLGCCMRQRWAWWFSIVIVAGFIWFVTIPKNGQALYTKANFMIAEQHWLEALDASYMGQDALIIDRFSTAWTLREKAALPPHLAWGNRERIEGEFFAGAYSQVFLVERLTAGQDGALRIAVPAVAWLNEGYESELLAEKSFRVGTLTRVHRLNF